jgi:hypothetical protein
MPPEVRDSEAIDRVEADAGKIHLKAHGWEMSAGPRSDPHEIVIVEIPAACRRRPDLWAQPLASRRKMARGASHIG